MPAEKFSCPAHFMGLVASVTLSHSGFKLHVSDIIVNDQDNLLVLVQNLMENYEL